MNRQQFMDMLESLLQDIPANERREAIQYYNDYFDDAGEENEARVIEELGSPGQVARLIREGMSEGSSEYTEKGYEDTRFRNYQEVSADYCKKKKPEPTRGQSGSNLWKILCIVLLCLLLLPVIVPVGLAVLAAAAGIIIAVLGVGIGAVAAGIALLIAGIATIGFGIFKIFLTPALGIAMGGVGCLILALGILISLLFLWCFCKLIPFCIRGLVSLIRYPLRKAGIVK